MIVGIVSDIHGNRRALDAVLESARGLGVERLLFLGDLVGYYYEPAACLERLAAWPWDGVRGNHEDMLAEVAADPNALARRTAKYGSGLAAALVQLSGKDRQLLAALPVTRHLEIDGFRVLLCHGSPERTNEYVYPDAPAARRNAMAVEGYDLVLFGHTHYPVVWHEGPCAVANPGSVGQPRNRQPGAHWLTWDTKSGLLHPRCEDYDIDALAAECRRHDAALPYLANVLLRCH